MLSDNDFPTLPLPPRERIGLIAGNGTFPIAFARLARQMGMAVYCAGVLNMVRDDLREACDDFMSAPLGKMGRAIRYFHRAGVQRIVMAGKIDKTVLFEKFRWIRHLPDWRTIQMVWRHLRQPKSNNSDDSLLLSVIREFELDGFKFESAVDICPELLVKHGFLTRRKPSPSQWKDVKFGWEMAKEIGRLDIGQTVVVCDQAVIAVEAIEGTDEAIRRAGQLCRRGGLTIVKVAKPQQDRRFDMPTVGTTTIQSMQAAGARVLAIESDQTIILDEPEVVEMANRFGLCIVALNAEELRLQMAS